MPSVPVFSRFTRRPRGTASPFASATPTPAALQRPLPPPTRPFPPTRSPIESIPGPVPTPHVARARSALSYHAPAPSHPDLRRLRGLDEESARLRADALLTRDRVAALRAQLRDSAAALDAANADLHHTRAQRDRAVHDRDQARAEARAAQDAGPASELAAAKRETARVNHDLVNLQLRVLELQRDAGCVCRGNCHVGVAHVVQAQDEAAGYDVMARIAAGRAPRLDEEGEQDEDEAASARDWRAQEIARLEMLLAGEHEARMQLEGAVDHLMATLDRRDEEEKRSSTHLEGRRRMAEDRLRAVTRQLHVERERREAGKVVGDVKDSPLDVRHGLRGEEGLWADVINPSAEVFIGGTECA